MSSAASWTTNWPGMAANSSQCHPETSAGRVRAVGMCRRITVGRKHSFCA